MTDTNRLGPALGKRVLATATLDLVRAYASTYLADAERQHGLTAGRLERPRDYERLVTFSKWPEVHLPAVLCMIPGLAAPPSRRGDGEHFGTWSVALIGIVHGADHDDGDIYESVYGSALRSLVLNQGGRMAGITALGIEQVGEAYDDLPTRRGRSVRGVTVEFEVQVRRHASTGRPLAAPPTPDPIGDPGPYPTADTVTVDLTKTPSA